MYNIAFWGKTRGQGDFHIFAVLRGGGGGVGTGGVGGGGFSGFYGTFYLQY